MPRPLRPQVAGGVYHLTARGNRRSAIYRDEGDNALFLSLLLLTVDRCAWELHAWCLMTTHYHLLVTTPEPNLAAGMQYVNSRYAEAFNARYGLSGHVFQGRYGSVVVGSDEQLALAYRYVARNPVRAGICRRADEWPWSSYAGLVRRWEGRLYAPPALLARVGAGGLRALRTYVDGAGADEAGAVARGAMAGV
jgi:REP element-mobilizing transposase RayT